MANLEKTMVKLTISHNLVAIGVAIGAIAEQISELPDYKSANELLDICEKTLIPMAERLNKEIGETLKNGKI